MDAIPRFAADRMLLRLARRLRLLGADTIFDTGIDGAAMLKRARIEGRIMLTRDKRLRTAPDVVFLDSDNFVEQLRSVLAHHPFDVFEKAFSRCSRCNTPLIMVDRDVIRARIPPFIYASHEKFAECPHCAHLYWPGTHPDRILQDLRRLQEASEASNRG